MTQQARPFDDLGKNRQKIAKNVQQIETLDTLETKSGTSEVETRTTTRLKDADTKNQKPKSVLDNTILSGWLTWETVAWAAIIILAIVTRLIDLGPRAMHHDESIHANFSYGMFKGNSIVKYDPVYHGPFLYYMVSFAYFLFGGATETTARIMPAFFGIGIVVLCYFLRPLIGKIGALTMGVFMLISPSILYYSRSLRHDIFATFGEFLCIVGIFRYMQTKPGHKGWWLFLAGIGLAIIFSSHEMVFLNAAMIVSFIGLALILEFVALPKRIRNRVNDLEEEEGELEVESRMSKVESQESDGQGAVVSDQNDESNPQPSSFTPTMGGHSSEQSSKVNRKSSIEWLLVTSRFLPIFFAAAFAALVLIGAPNLFQNTTTTAIVNGVTQTVQSTGIPRWLLIIPAGLLLALLVGYSIGTLLNYGFRRLQPKPLNIAAAISAISFIGLAALVIFMAGRAAKKVEEAGAASGVPGVGPVGQPSNPVTDTVTATVSKDFSAFGLKMPALVPQMLIVLIISLLIGMVIGWMWQRRFFVYTERGIYGASISFFAVMLVASLVSLRFTSPIAGANGRVLPKGNLFMVGPEVDKWMAYVFNGFLLALIVGVLAGWLVSLADVIPDEDLRGSATLRGILRMARRPWIVGAFVLGFAIIYVPLFSNFFFYVEGLADGIYKGVEVWAGAHDTRRLDQPWFYYPWIMALYETLPMILWLVAIVAFPVSFVTRALRKGRIVFTVRGLLTGLSVWWATLAMIVYSIAGEKAPWLNMQVALPASLAAAILVDSYLRKVNWRQLVQPGKGVLFAGLFILNFAAICVLIGLWINLPSVQATSQQPGAGALFNDNLRTQQVVEMAIVGLVAVIIFGAIFWLWRSERITGRLMRATIALLFSGLLLAYGIKSTIALNYTHPDTATEMLIYVQTTPEVPLFMQRLDRLARDLRDSYKVTPPAAGTVTTQIDPSNSRGLPVLVTQEAAWPMVWYLRDYTGVNFTTPNQDATNTPAVPLQDSRGNNYVVIIVRDVDNTPKLQEQLRAQYTSHQYKMRWWFPEDTSGYGGLGLVPPDSANPDRDRKKLENTDWAKWGQALTEQPYAGRLWRFLMYRELSQPLQSTDMIVYVRNDVEPDFGLLEGSNSGVSAGAQPSATNSAQTGTQTSQTAFGLTESNQPGLRNGQYKTPRNITVAPNGDFLVLDSGNGRIQRFSRDGQFISKFGQIGTGEGQFQLAQYDGGAGGIVTDEDGNIYVADSWNYRIQKFDKDGKFLQAWGNGFDTQGDPAKNASNPFGLYGPRGMAYDREKGELYVADTGNRRVLVYNKQGQFVRQFGSIGAGPGQFNEPVSVAIAPDGKVYVTDLRNKRIQVLSNTGQFIKEIKISNGWQEQPLSEPFIAFDVQGNFYVTDSPNGRIYKYSPDGQVLQTIENQPGAAMVNPIGLVVAPDGMLYVADAKRNAIVKLKP